MGKFEDPEKKRARGRRYYYANVARESARSMEKRRRLIAACKALLQAHLDTHPCVDCGEGDPIVLEFDHIDPRRKLFTMAEARRGKRRLALVVQELAKCVVRCANCHRRRTAAQAQSGEVIFGIPREAFRTARKAPNGKAVGAPALITDP